METQTQKLQLKTNRSLIKFIFLSIITLGIYGYIATADIEYSINTLASKYDGKKTMNYWLLILIVSPITAGIGLVIWTHRLSKRMGAELKRRNIPYSFGASTYWICGVLGSLIIVGPFIFLHKQLKATNLLCEDYNRVG